MHIDKTLEEFRQHVGELYDIIAAVGVLSWDQATHMPSKGAQARASVIATLSRLVHEKLISKKTFAFLDSLEGQPEPTSIEDALLQLVRREAERAKKLPTEFVQESKRLTSLANGAWQEARQKKDFQIFAPHLEQIFEMAKRKADYFGYDDHPYTALMSDFDPGLRTDTVRELFSTLRGRIRSLVGTIQSKVAASGEVDTSFLNLEYDETLQEAFGRTIVAALGYDFERGRLDRSAHPFSITFARDDSRMTTRYSKDFLPTSIFGTIHETGHALYEQGVDPVLARTLLSRGTSSSIHESQSRLFENLIGRSLPFWKHWYPKLQAVFPQQLAEVSLKQFYRAINRVTPSLIRVDADAVTYDLHIMLRTELEIALLEGKLKVSELPEAWNARVREDFGLEVPDDARGVLQDVHWSHGMIGSFPNYTVGNVLSVQFMQTAEQEIGSQSSAFEQGEYAPLLGWLRERIHRFGRRLLPNELVEQVTGQPIRAEPYLQYLEQKFTDLYGIERLEA